MRKTSRENPPYLGKKNRIEKKTIFNIKSNILRSHHYNSEKNYFGYNRIVNMAKIILFNTFNLNFFKILMR